MNGNTGYDRETPVCERCKVKLEYLSDSLLMTASASGGLRPGGGPLTFRLYRCPECRELKFFEL